MSYARSAGAQSGGVAGDGSTAYILRLSNATSNIAVQPPDGWVRVAAPLHFSDESIRLAIIDRLAWIRRQQAQFQRQERQTPRQYVSGESHYVAGRQYRLDVIEHDAAPAVRLLRNASFLELRVRPHSDRDKREAVLYAWYRQQLREVIPELIAKWEPVLGMQVAAWGIKRMKTRWGTCNIADRRIWLNLELAKKLPPCLEYVVVHELVHLLVRLHNAAFFAHLDRVLPNWRWRRDELNRAPLAHEVWGSRDET